MTWGGDSKIFHGEQLYVQPMLWRRLIEGSGQHIWVENAIGFYA